MSKKVPKEMYLKKLEGRSLKILDYAGTRHSNQTLFRCNTCDYEWRTQLASILAGNGCHKCSGKVRVTKEEAIIRLKNRSITMTHYCGNTHGASTFECDICSHEWQTSFMNVYRGRGCIKCSGKMQLTEDQCSDKLKDRPVSLKLYAGTTSGKSQFECIICKYVWVTTFNSVSLGSGCPSCTKTARVTLGICTDRLKGRNINLLHYSGNVSTKSLFKCNICSYEWRTTFNKISQGKGYPSCAKTGFNPSKPAWIYILRINTIHGDCYGFGVTNTIKSRIATHKKNLGPMLDEFYEPIYFESGKDAWEFECKWKQSPYIIDINIEGFRTECVLVNNETTKMIFN